MTIHKPEQCEGKVVTPDNAMRNSSKGDSEPGTYDKALHEIVDYSLDDDHTENST